MEHTDLANLTRVKSQLSEENHQNQSSNQVQAENKALLLRHTAS